MSRIGVEILDWRRSADWSPESVGGGGGGALDRQQSGGVFDGEGVLDRQESGGVLDGVVLYCLLVSLRRWCGNPLLARRSSMMVR